MNDRGRGQASFADGAFFSGLQRATRFVLVRHGESEGNRDGLFQGRSDYPLTDRGRLQAAARGRDLARLGPALVFCSPLSRARETASILAAEAGLPAPRVLDELKELDTGAWTDRTWAALKAEGGDAWARFHAESWAAVPGAESPDSLYGRALRAWAALRDAALTEGAGAVVAVTHGGFLQWLVRSTFGWGAWLPLVPATNCGIYELDVEPSLPGRAFVAWKTMDGTLPPVD